MPHEKYDGPTPQPVLHIASGHRTARLLSVARELDLFTLLSARPMTSHELADRLALDAGATRDLAHALVGLGLLERDGTGRYRTTPVATRYLDTNGPHYIGGFLDFLDRQLNPAWDLLIERLRPGGGPASADPYRPLYADETGRTAFLEAMDVINTPHGHQLSGELDWSGVDEVLEVGGARGNLSAILAGRHPRLRATVFDLPELAEPCRRHVEALGLGGRVRFHAGDFFTDDLPAGADVVIVGHVLHNWPDPVRRMLVGKAFAALRPGGQVLIYDAMVEDERPAFGNALVSIDMRVWSAGGSEYTPQECTEWLREAGFVDVRQHPIGASSLVLRARRPDHRPVSAGSARDTGR
ncbi:methyltransferase [Dactylosporangium fulvum]|uniref:Acetylserotonin O-methyltransferase n=1 Tax=Dactylosporangium fulvum TaxID=53359 RepID=A0ABY5W954_9ACTN|nr:acetylserotonin O-methyltransferase [Dactylosporangium fulvum]UWP86082.1 acetylserotonin O-methyltransferase [Dactylosporangium fulvum]